VLDGEVHTDPAHRRHRVGGVADTQEPRSIPLAQSVHLDGEGLDVVPFAELADAVAEEGDEPRDLLAEGVEPALVHGLDRSLRDRVAALPVLAALDQDEDRAGREATYAVGRIGRAPRDSKPEDIHRRADLLPRGARRWPDGGMPAVRRHDE